jgi:hypothetical protein
MVTKERTKPQRVTPKTVARVEKFRTHSRETFDDLLMKVLDNAEAYEAVLESGKYPLVTQHWEVVKKE